MKLKADFVTIALIVILILSVGMLAFSLKDFFSSKPEVSQAPNQMKSTSRMTLTSFDKELARQLMDQDNDGRCDVCGMPIEQCIESGQIECSMGSNAKTGILGSQHIHADFKIDLNGEPLNFANNKYYMKSSFLHLDDNQNKEDASGVLHMHATGVPLWIFFKSIGMDFNKYCITLENKEKFCTDGNKKLKFFVNGKENNDFENYVFNNLDKILISYGSESEEEIKNQFASITDFAKLH